MKKKKKNKKKKALKIISKTKRMKLAQKNFYNFENSSLVFDSISPLWFLGENTKRGLTKVATYFIFSSFTLHYLQYISNIIEKKLKIKKPSSSDLIETKKKLNTFLQKIPSLFNTDLIDWAQNECVPALTELVKYLNISSYSELARLANLLQRELKILKVPLEEKNESELLSYDVFYNILSKIKSYGYLSILDKSLFDQGEEFEFETARAFGKGAYLKKIYEEKDRRIIIEALSLVSITEEEINPMPELIYGGKKWVMEKIKQKD